jgi:phage virion morphogenesis protein
MIEVTIESENVLNTFQRLADGLAPERLKAPLMKIGQELVESTENRFQTKTTPSGTPWAENAPSTIKRKGKDSPLVDTGIFSRSFLYQVEDTTLTVGTNYLSGPIPGIGAAVHQFGSRNGKIPARPFLGLSTADEAMIVSEVNNYLRSVIGD